MTKLGKKNQKRLAKLVVAALMCTGGGLFSPPSVASASEVTVTNVTGSGTAVDPYVVKPDGSMEQIFITSVNPHSPTNCYYAPTADILKITGTITASSIRFYGGFNRSPGTCVSGKTVNINGTEITVHNIYGGLNESGNVEGNTVNVESGTITLNSVGGGLVETQTSDPSTGSAIGNHLNITGGNLSGYGCTIYGGFSRGGDTENNTVTISGGTIHASNIYGGETIASGKKANGNVVTIHGGTVTIDGAFSGIYGGYASSIMGPNGNEASGNTVTIDGGTVTFDGANSRIYGGYASKLMGVIDTEASGNTVTIGKDATLLGSNTCIFGGYAQSGFPPNQVLGTTNNNTVNILKAITVKQIVGGSNLTEGTGNTLNIAAKGVIVGEYGVAGFQNMNFYLPSDIANNDTMLTVNGSEATDVKGVTFGVAALSGVKLVKGDTVNLITNPNGLATDDTLKTTDSATLAKAKFLSANSLTTDDAYELSISKKDANTIIATVDNVTEKKAPEEAVGDILKSLVETRAGVVTMINAGADLLVSQGMANAADAAAAERTEGDAAAAPRTGGFAPFAAVSIGKLRAESGSHVDTKGIGLNLGFAKEIENKSGKLLVGPVVEYGHGSYDSYQDNGITADGKSSYWGIGVIAKQTNHNGFYYEGSIRAGRTKSDYGSDNVKPGTHVSYDSSATYWAAHLGVGKLADIGHDNTLDYYGKYFYSHTGSDSTYLNGANETANFDAVNSHRIRLGARITHALNAKNKIYGGLAWQYEFNGDARATYSVSGEAPSPSVKGSSGMIELGWQVKPGKSPMTIDLGVTGWVGKQRGITANLQANWTF